MERSKPADHESVPDPTRRLETVAAALLGGHAVVWVAMLVWSPVAALREDVARFVQIATTPGLPYRDVPVEYAPLETLVIRVCCGTSVGHAAGRIAVISAACDVGIFLVLRSHWSLAAAAWYLGFALPLQVFLVFRLDLLFVLLAVGGVALATGERAVAGGLTFAAAIVGKIWPIVLLPVLWLRGTRRALAACLLATVAVAVAWVSIGGPEGIRYVTSFRGATGWQVESMVGSTIALFTREQVRMEAGAVRIGTIPGWAGPALTFITVLALIAVWARTHGRADDPAGMPSVAAVAVLVALSPVSSAQYVAWILPWAAIAVAERRRIPVAVGTLAASVLAASVFLVYWNIAGTVRTLSILAFARALCIVVLIVAWVRERPLDHVGVSE